MRFYVDCWIFSGFLFVVAKAAHNEPPRQDVKTAFSPTQRLSQWDQQVNNGVNGQNAVYPRPEFNPSQRIGQWNQQMLNDINGGQNALDPLSEFNPTQLTNQWDQQMNYLNGRQTVLDPLTEFNPTQRIRQWNQQIHNDITGQQNALVNPTKQTGQLNQTNNGIIALDPLPEFNPIQRTGQWNQIKSDINGHNVPGFQREFNPAPRPVQSNHQANNIKGQHVPGFQGKFHPAPRAVKSKRQGKNNGQHGFQRGLNPAPLPVQSNHQGVSSAQRHGQGNHNANNKNGNNGHGHAKWDYGDKANGPEFWPVLFPARCGGLYQSPVDIITEETVYQPTLTEFTFLPPSPMSRFVVHCNGHTVQVSTKGDFYMYGGGLQDVYKAEQFHFHWGDNSQYGSEHTIDSVEYPIEMHIVNWNTNKYRSMDEAAKHPGGIAVLAVLFEVSMYDNPLIEEFVQVIPHVKDPDWDKRIEGKAMTIRNLLPRGIDKYYRYHGSLTTPSCFQSVVWTVYDEKLTISERQLNVFRSVLKHKNNAPTHHGQGFTSPEELVPGMTNARETLVNNFRPVQPLNGRTVYRSFPQLSGEL